MVIVNPYPSSGVFQRKALREIGEHPSGTIFPFTTLRGISQVIKETLANSHPGEI